MNGMYLRDGTFKLSPGQYLERLFPLLHTGLGIGYLNSVNKFQIQVHCIDEVHSQENISALPEDERIERLV